MLSAVSFACIFHIKSIFNLRKTLIYKSHFKTRFDSTVSETNVHSHRWFQLHEACDTKDIRKMIILYPFTCLE